MVSSFTWFDKETTTKGINEHKQLTWLSEATFVNDSKADPSTAYGLFDRARRTLKVAFSGFMTYGDVFGGFFSVAVTEQIKRFFDPNMIIFSFESHGRCMTPQRFVAREERKENAPVMLWRNKRRGFVT